MLTVGLDNLLEYLVRTGRLSHDQSSRAFVEPLSGGVSNEVLRVSFSGQDDFVVKQSRRQLRTRKAWHSQPERIWRERDVMETLPALLPAGLVPRVLFEDRDNFLFAMEAIPANHLVWKSELLDGEARPDIARRLGIILGTIHSRTSGNEQLATKFSDRTVFDELRLDPFYRFVAQRHSEIRQPLERLIEETLRTTECLVLGDFSPKNILLVPSEVGSDGEQPRLVLVDFETGHYGDPAFDLGFFLSHLLLKTIKHAARVDEFLAMVRTFWSAYRSQLIPRESAAVAHLAACLRARVDGKSTVDYLTTDGETFVRETTTDWLLTPLESVESAFTNLERRLKSIRSC